MRKILFLCSRLLSSPECLVQRVEGTTTSVLLPGFSVASLRLVLKFLEVGEVAMATHQWEEVASLLRALELSSEVQSEIYRVKYLTGPSPLNFLIKNSLKTPGTSGIAGSLYMGSFTQSQGASS